MTFSVLGITVSIKRAGKERCPPARDLGVFHQSVEAWQEKLPKEFTFGIWRFKQVPGRPPGTYGAAVDRYLNPVSEDERR